MSIISMPPGTARASGSPVQVDPVRLVDGGGQLPGRRKGYGGARGRDVGVPYLPTLPTPEGPAKQGFIKTMTEAGLL